MTSGTEKTEAQMFAEVWDSDGSESPKTPTAADVAEVPAATNADEQPETPAAKKDEGSGEEQTADDWLAGVDPAIADRIRADRKQAEDRYNALHGRVAPLQRAFENIQREQRQATPAMPAMPDTGATQKQADSFFDSPRWKAWAEDYPGDAEIMQSAFERAQADATEKVSTLERRLEGLEGKVGSVAKVTSDIELNKQVSELERDHPDWQEINKGDTFWEWFDTYRATQPAEVRAAYYDPPTLDRWFNDAGFTGRMITNFKRETNYARPTEGQQESAPAPTATKPDVRLRMSESPDVRGSSRPPSTIPLDSMSPKEQFDAIWKSANKSS